MPTATELAAKRRAKLLARSQKGIQVSSVTAESMEEEDAAQAAAAASAASAQGTPQKVEKDESAQNTPAAESTTEDDAVEMTTPASAEADADNNSATVDTLASSSATTPVNVSDLDSILDSAVADTTTTTTTAAAADNNSSEEPSSEKKRESLRPLAARREKIMAAKKKAAAEAAAEGEADEGEEEEEKEKFRFISKTAREVEMEIAAQTKKNDDDVSGSNDRVLEKELSEKVLMGKDKGSTAASSSSSSGSSKGGSSIKRRTRTGAGASSPKVSSSPSPKDSSSSPSSSSSALSKEEKAKETALERKIDSLIQQQQAVDGTWLPKLLRVLMLVALAAYAGYCSYLESPEGVSVLVMKKEGDESGGFGRQFFDLSSLGMGPALHTIQAGGRGDAIDEAAFDMATNSGLGGGPAGHGLDYVPTFECSSAWSDTTSISFAVIMVLGTISDRLLKQNTPGKKEQEGLSGYLAWFWEIYGQGWEFVYDYAFGYVGEYCAYWIIIIAVSAGLSYASSVGSPLVPMHGGGALELSGEL